MSFLRNKNTHARFIFSFIFKEILLYCKFFVNTLKIYVLVCYYYEVGKIPAFFLLYCVVSQNLRLLHQIQVLPEPCVIFLTVIGITNYGWRELGDRITVRGSYQENFKLILKWNWICVCPPPMTQLSFVRWISYYEMTLRKTPV